MNKAASAFHVRTILATISVFALAGVPRAQQPPRHENPVLQGDEVTETNGFSFPGGGFNDFVSAVKEQGGLDLRKYAEIPMSSQNIWVPKMRLNSRRFRNLAELYNYVSMQGDGYLGKWIVSPPDVAEKKDIPNAIVFLPPNRADGAFAVRAFSLHGINAKPLVKLILEERDHLATQHMQSHSFARDDLSGDVRVSESGGILVASGGKIFIQLVEELVDASRPKTPPKTPTSAAEARPGQ